PEKAGSASSLTQVSTEFGYGLGVATVGTLGTAVYRLQMAIPDAVPAEAAARARENVAEGVAVAAELPSPGVLAAAREAFTVALNSVAGLSAVVLAIVAVVVAVKLRELPPIGSSVPEEPAEAAEPVRGGERDGTAAIRGGAVACGAGPAYGGGEQEGAGRGPVGARQARVGEPALD